MSNLIKKENLMVVVDSYVGQDGQQKNQHKQIGELITVMGTDGPYQFFKLWGPHGVTEGKVWEPKDSTQQPVTQQPAPPPPMPQNGYQQQYAAPQNMPHGGGQYAGK